MLKSKKSIFVFSSLFALIELALAFAVHLVSRKLFRYFAYFSILLSLIYALFLFCERADYMLTLTGLICTAFADYFLVLIEVPRQIPAMLFFTVTQISYFALLYMRDNEQRRLHLATRGVLVSIFLVLTVLVLGEKTDLLSIISIFYFSNLLVNIIWAFTRFRESSLFAIGLLLFAMCDVCVGLSVMSSSYIPIPEGTILDFLANPPINLAWVFYIPSQTLIALSLAENKIKLREIS